MVSSDKRLSKMLHAGSLEPRYRVGSRINDVKVNAVGRRRLTFCFVGWCAFIFATSCTVVRPQEFMGLIQYFFGLEPESLARFELFWGSAWVLFVKGWHFTEFAVLTLLCSVALRSATGATTVWPIYAAMAFCFLFAISDEWHQSFVPARRGTLEDVLIDSLGVAAAGAILRLRHYRRGSRCVASDGVRDEMTPVEAVQ